MLILTREVNQKVFIGSKEEPIGEIVVTDIKGGRVQLGFEFPREIEIRRAERKQIPHDARA